ncbi:unnamed protein product [Owenia fusiformis]|uniref:CRAL-TRIO domain-containing protein n=1 Tax=Owenia fusiformis TaxID=6347 RepID=A0A8S4PJP9_OWEFU|nr:unnamed protein product [Owenia fusiformis]
MTSIADQFDGFKALFTGETYECKLDAKSLKKAKDELNEDPREREAALKQFRQWVKEQPHYTCCLDSTFLLMFLRRCKFSQLEARKMLDHYITMSVKMVPEWMLKNDILDPRAKAAFLTGFCVPLPQRDDQGRRLLLMKPGVLNPEKNEYDGTDVYRAIGAMFMVLQREDMTQVNGYVFFQDYTGMSPKHITFFGIENMKKSTKFWQDNFPARFKEMHYYNTGAVFEAIMQLIKPFLSKKIQDRIKVYGNNMEDVYKNIPMKCLPSDYLPDDYKGSNTYSMMEIVESFYKKMSELEISKRIKYCSTELMGLDESKRPSNKDEPQASFRKLNID